MPCLFLSPCALHSTHIRDVVVALIMVPWLGLVIALSFFAALTARRCSARARKATQRRLWAGVVGVGMFGE